MSDNKPTFAGSAEQQALAEQIFQLMKAQGSFYAADAPIQQTLDNLADFFAAQRKADRAKVAQEIDTALSTNDSVFTREERGDDVIYVISRLGAYRPRQEDTSHMFKQRLYEPENPLPVDDISVFVTTTRPALTTVEPVFISDYWQQQAGLTPVALGDGEQEAVIELHEAAEVAPVVEEPIEAEEIIE